MGYSHTVEYYSALEKKDVLTHAAGMNLEDVVLREMS